MTFHWPQYIYLALIAGNLLVNVIKQGESSKEVYSFHRSFTASVVIFLLLYFGGFFAGAAP